MDILLISCRPCSLRFCFTGKRRNVAQLRVRIQPLCYGFSFRQDKLAVWGIAVIVHEDDVFEAICIGTCDRPISRGDQVFGTLVGGRCFANFMSYNTEHMVVERKRL